MTTRTPHVLMLFEYSTLNGGERSALALIEAIRRTGFRIEAAAPAAGDLANALLDLGVVVMPFSTHDAMGVRRPREELRRELATLVQRQNPDLVHANSLSMGRLAGPVLCDSGIPSIGHLRDIMKVSNATIADLNCHSRLLAVSHATRDWYLDAGLDAAKSQVMYNGVDFRTFRPRSPNGYLHEELRLPSEAMLIGSIGQIGMRKGLDTVFAAALRVVAKHPQTHFLIVGQRYSAKQEAVDYERQLDAMAATAPLAGHVHFLGYRCDMPRLLNELTLLVHAARQEPLGRVLLEAAASGTPTIATDVGGTREIFPDSSAGRLVPPGDAEALAAQVIQLLDAPAVRSGLSAVARQRAEQSFDARRTAQTLGEHYQDVLNRSPTPR